VERGAELRGDLKLPHAPVAGEGLHAEDPAPGKPPQNKFVLHTRVNSGSGITIVPEYEWEDTPRSGVSILESLSV
jgi:hypothetical protein